MLSSKQWSVPGSRDGEHHRLVISWGWKTHKVSLACQLFHHDCCQIGQRRGVLEGVTMTFSLLLAPPRIQTEWHCHLLHICSMSTMLLFIRILKNWFWDKLSSCNLFWVKNYWFNIKVVCPFIFCICLKLVKNYYSSPFAHICHGICTYWFNTVMVLIWSLSAIVCQCDHFFFLYWPVICNINQLLAKSQGISWICILTIY